MTLVYRRVWEAIHQAQPDFSFDQLMAEREHLICTNSYGNYSMLALRYLDPRTWETVHLAIQAEVRAAPLVYYTPVPGARPVLELSLIHISEPTRLGMISYAVFC